MKILQIRYSGLTLFENDLTVDFTASQRVEASARENLIEIVDKKVYTNPVIEFAGVNASGKTLTLKAIQFAFAVATGEPVNSSKYQQTMLEMVGDKPVQIVIWFFHNERFYVLTTEVCLCGSAEPTGKSICLQNDALYVQNKTLVKKTDWKQNPESDEFNFYRLIQRRKDAGEYLPHDVSINIALMNRAEERLEYIDLLSTVNHNHLKKIGDYIPEVVQFLDPNIEYLRINKQAEGKLASFSLKFMNSEKELILRDYAEIENYLSSGTIKGIGLFMMSIFSFYTGSYLFVDELENHFNLEIVKTLIRFFLDRSINIKGATLIFSTHYPELLDEPPRNDAIYILRNSGRITCTNLSKILIRNDGIKRSEAFISDYLQGTAPSYEKYLSLKMMIPQIGTSKKCSSNSIGGEHADN